MVPNTIHIAKGDPHCKHPTHGDNSHVRVMQRREQSLTSLQSCARQDTHNDIQDVLGQNYGVPDDIDEEELLGELDDLEADMAFEAERGAASGTVPSYLQVPAHPCPPSPCSPHELTQYRTMFGCITLPADRNTRLWPALPSSLVTYLPTGCGPAGGARRAACAARCHLGAGVWVASSAAAQLSCS